MRKLLFLVLAGILGAAAHAGTWTTDKLELTLFEEEFPVIHVRITNISSWAQVTNGVEFCSRNDNGTLTELARDTISLNPGGQVDWYPNLTLIDGQAYQVGVYGWITGDFTYNYTPNDPGGGTCTCPDYTSFFQQISSLLYEIIGLLEDIYTGQVDMASKLVQIYNFMTDFLQTNIATIVLKLETISTTLSAFKASVETYLTQIKSAIEMVNSSIIENLTILAQKIDSSTSSVLAAIETMRADIVAAISSPQSGVIQKLSEVIQAVDNCNTAIVAAVMETKGAITYAVTSSGQAVVNAVTNISAPIVTATNNVKTAVDDARTGIMNSIADWFGQLIAFLTEPLTKLTDYIVFIFNKLQEFCNYFINKTWCDDLLQKVYDVVMLSDDDVTMLYNDIKALIENKTPLKTINDFNNAMSVSPTSNQMNFTFDLVGAGTIQVPILNSIPLATWHLFRNMAAGALWIIFIAGIIMRLWPRVQMT